MQAEPHPDLDDSERELDREIKHLARLSERRRIQLDSDRLHARAEKRRKRIGEFAIAHAALGSPSYAVMAQRLGFSKSRLLDLKDGEPMRPSEAEAIRNAILEHIAAVGATK